jgi:hypothetical protein
MWLELHVPVPDGMEIFSFTGKHSLHGRGMRIGSINFCPIVVHSYIRIPIKSGMIFVYETLYP